MPTKAQLEQRITDLEAELREAHEKNSKATAVAEAPRDSDMAGTDMIARRIVIKRASWDKVLAHTEVLRVKQAIVATPAEVAAILLAEAIDRESCPDPLNGLADTLTRAAALVCELERVRNAQADEVLALRARVAELESRPVSSEEVERLTRELDESKAAHKETLEELEAKQKEFAELNAKHEECESKLECDECDAERSSKCASHTQEDCKHCGEPSTVCEACANEQPDLSALAGWVFGMGATLVDVLPLARTDEGAATLQRVFAHALPTMPQGTFAFDPKPADAS